MGIKTKYLFHWVLMGIKYINTDHAWQNACHRVTTKASLNFLSQKHLSLSFFFSSVGRHEGEGIGGRSEEFSDLLGRMKLLLVHETKYGRPLMVFLSPVPIAL